MAKTASGSPMIHSLSAYAGSGGCRARSPRGAPPSAQAAMVAMASSLRLRSLAQAPTTGSASHGGISRSTTFWRIARAQGRASS